ncbi:hypothetical protein TKK_0015420 [Trichogramma kaykai]
MKLYKNYLETGKIQDIPRSTLYRKRKKKSTKTSVIKHHEKMRLFSMSMKQKDPNLPNDIETGCKSKSCFNILLHVHSNNNIKYGEENIERLSPNMSLSQEKPIEENCISEQNMDIQLHNELVELNESLQTDSLLRPKSLFSMMNNTDFLTRINTQTTQKKDIYGIKYVTPFINLRKLHIIDGYPADYMHTCCAGVGKQVLELILSTLSTYDIIKIDEYMSEIAVPHQLSRSCRLLKERKDWKAKEWENFILHYSLPVFKSVLSDLMYNYWKLFVDSMFIILSDKISFTDLDLADEMLHHFVYRTRKIFTKRAMTFNIHQLMHLATSVANWGPVFDHSCFPFEGANHHLLQAIHCARGVNMQIARYCNLQKTMLAVERIVYPCASPSVVDFCSKFGITRTKNSVAINDMTYVGKCSVPSNELLARVNLPLNSTLLYFKMIKSGVLYAVENNRSFRTNNSYAVLKNGSFIKILLFIVNDDLKVGLILYRELIITKNISRSIFKFERDQKIQIKNISDIKRICVYIKIDDNEYVSLIPNSHHY